MDGYNHDIKSIRMVQMFVTAIKYNCRVKMAATVSGMGTVKKQKLKIRIVEEPGWKRFEKVICNM